MKILEPLLVSRFEKAKNCYAGYGDLFGVRDIEYRLYKLGLHNGQESKSKLTKERETEDIGLELTIGYERVGYAIGRINNLREHAKKLLNLNDFSGAERLIKNMLTDRQNQTIYWRKSLLISYKKQGAEKQRGYKISSVKELFVLTVLSTWFVLFVLIYPSFKAAPNDVVISNIFSCEKIEKLLYTYDERISKLMSQTLRFAKKMSVPSKIHNIQLVQTQPEERLAATSELNLASCLVTGCGEARGRGYWAATQVKGFSSEINGKIVQTTLRVRRSVLIFKRLSDQLIVLMKQGNACGGKGLAEETLRQEHIKGYGG